MRVWYDMIDLDEKMKVFVRRETPGRRMLNTPRLVPVLYLSKAGKNRRKKNKRKDRKSAIVRFTELV